MYNKYSRVIKNTFTFIVMKIFLRKRKRVNSGDANSKHQQQLEHIANDNYKHSSFFILFVTFHSFLTSLLLYSIEDL